MLLPIPAFVVTPPVWLPLPAAPVLVATRPRLLASRLALLGVRTVPTLGFGTGAAAIEPGLEFFRAGRTIGGPGGTSYRGVRASSFPIQAIVLGSGAPLETWPLGLAGASIGF